MVDWSSYVREELHSAMFFNKMVFYIICPW